LAGLGCVGFLDAAQLMTRIAAPSGGRAVETPPVSFRSQLAQFVDPHVALALIVIVFWLVLLNGLIQSWLINAGVTALFARPDANGKAVATLDSTQIVTTIVAISGLFTTALGFIWGYFFSQRTQAGAAEATKAVAGAAAQVADTAQAQGNNIALGQRVRAIGRQRLDTIIDVANAHSRLSDQDVARAQTRGELFATPSEEAVTSLRLLRDELTD
jgi:hypothetical protein